MGAGESTEFKKNDPRFDYPDSSTQTDRTEKYDDSSKHPKYSFEEENKYAGNTQITADGYDDSKQSISKTPTKELSYRKQVFSDMTRRVLKNKENHSSKKFNPSASIGSKLQKNGRNIDTDGIEWVKKEEIIDSRLVSSRPYGTKTPKEKLFGPGSTKNAFIKVKSGVLTYLPAKALSTIISYDMGSYRKYMSVCASWHVTIKEALDLHFNKVENDFVLKYHQNLLFTQSFTSSSAIKF